jgi:hypothetical protein
MQLPMSNDYNADALDAYESKIGFIKGFLANAVCRNGEKPHFTTVDVNYKGELMKIEGFVDGRAYTWFPDGKCKKLFKNLKRSDFKPFDLITNILDNHEPAK